MKITKHVVHAIFECGCGKNWQNFLTAKASAKRHAEATGHTVTGEEGVAIVINPRSAPQEKKP